MAFVITLEGIFIVLGAIFVVRTLSRIGRAINPNRKK